MITYQGRDYDFKLQKSTKEELREVKRKMKMTVRQLLEGIEQLDVDAMTAVRWLVLRSDGQHDDLVLDPDEDFDWWEWVESFSESETEDEKEEDPTRAGSLPATSTPQSSESSEPTLMSSATSTPSPWPDIAESVNGRPDGSLSEPSSLTSLA